MHKVINEQVLEMMKEEVYGVLREVGHYLRHLGLLVKGKTAEIENKYQDDALYTVGRVNRANTECYVVTIIPQCIQK